MLFMLYSKEFPPESSNHSNIIIMTSMLIFLIDWFWTAHLWLDSPLGLPCTAELIYNVVRNCLSALKCVMASCAWCSVSVSNALSGQCHIHSNAVALSSITTVDLDSTYWTTVSVMYKTDHDW